MKAEEDLLFFIRLRVDLLEGDYRLLYLAWLKAMILFGDAYDDEEFEDNDPEITKFE
jgi:hypothetical protein